jgi:signal transduction histidine kinase
LPALPLIIVVYLSTNPLIWISSEVHHFYIELFAVVFGIVLSFYYIARSRTLNDIFSLFIGMGFLVSAIIDLLHVIVSYGAISNPEFIKYFIPQTWFAGRIFLSTLLVMAIIKYSDLSKGEDDVYQSKEKQVKQQKSGKRVPKRILVYLLLLVVFSFGVALSSLILVFPASVIDEYSLHRPYEIPPLILFSVALFYFYKKQLYKRKDLFYKGLVGYLILDIFSQIIMSYSATSFDTAHNIAHVLKDGAYFVNIIALALSSLQYNVELKKSNEQIRIQNEMLKESGKMQKEFINIAAHELRTPIQPILGLSDVLASSKNNSAENRKVAEVIYRNAKKLQHLAEDILDVSKIESHTLNLKEEVFNIGDVILNTISDFEDSSKKGLGELLPTVKIIYKPKERNNDYDPIMVKADRMRISQVLSNLLSNANKSIIGTEGKSIKFIYVDFKRVEASGQKLPPQSHHQQPSKEEVAVISIQDEGSGINSELSLKLYEKFATGTYGGTGLGLYISKSIIESHGGKLWFEDNRNGRGVTFYFTLPIFYEMPVENYDGKKIIRNSKEKNNILIKKSKILSFVPSAHPKYNHNKSILLVDDDLDITITLKKVLEREGYNVHAFNDPLKTLKEFRKGGYNLIILDIKMPQMNGFDLYNEIRKIDDKVNVCFLTAGEINPADKEYQMISDNLLLRKPIENEVLLQAIENIKS